jgi:hypothetical protein
MKINKHKYQKQFIKPIAKLSLLLFSNKILYQDQNHLLRTKNLK